MHKKQSILFAAVFAALFFAPFAGLCAKELAAPDAVLKTTMPDAKEIKVEVLALSDDQKASVEKQAGVKLDAELDKEFRIYSGVAGGKTVGHAVEVKSKGKWGPISILVTIGSDNKVRDVTVLSMSERRGAVIARKNFLQQFSEKVITDVFVIDKTIKAASGATISSRAVISGVNKAIAVFKILKENVK